MDDFGRQMTMDVMRRRLLPLEHLQQVKKSPNDLNCGIVIYDRMYVCVDTKANMAGHQYGACLLLFYTDRR